MPLKTGQKCPYDSDRFTTVFVMTIRTCSIALTPFYLDLWSACAQKKNWWKLRGAMWSCETLLVGYEDVMMDAVAGEEADVVKRLKELHVSVAPFTVTIWFKKITNHLFKVEPYWINPVGVHPRRRSTRNSFPLPLSQLHAGHPRKFHQLKDRKPCHLPAWARRITRSENFVDVTTRYQTVQNPNICCYAIKRSSCCYFMARLLAVLVLKMHPLRHWIPFRPPSTWMIRMVWNLRPPVFFVTYCRSRLYYICHLIATPLRLQARLSQKAPLLHRQFPLLSLLTMMMQIMFIVMAMMGSPVTLPQLILTMMFLILCFMLPSSGPKFFQTFSPPRYYCLGVGCERALCPACPCHGGGVVCPWSEGGTS